MFLPRLASVMRARHSFSSGSSITRKPSSTSDFTVSLKDFTMAGSRCSRQTFSSRIVAPRFSSPARTRPRSTCSLKATARSVSSPPLVTALEPMRMRIPLAPATLRAGGWISAGMISTVQMPLPLRAAIDASDWPQRWAPSPESLITSTMCSGRVTAGFDRAAAPGLAWVFRSSWAVSLMVLPRDSFFWNG